MESWDELVASTNGVASAEARSRAASAAGSAWEVQVPSASPRQRGVGATTPVALLPLSPSSARAPTPREGEGEGEAQEPVRNVARPAPRTRLAPTATASDAAPARLCEPAGAAPQAALADALVSRNVALSSWLEGRVREGARHGCAPLTASAATSGPMAALAAGAQHASELLDAAIAEAGVEQRRCVAAVAALVQAGAPGAAIAAAAASPLDGLVSRARDAAQRALTASLGTLSYDGGGGELQAQREQLVALEGKLREAEAKLALLAQAAAGGTPDAAPGSPGYRMPSQEEGKGEAGGDDAAAALWLDHLALAAAPTPAPPPVPPQVPTAVPTQPPTPRLSPDARARRLSALAQRRAELLDAVQRSEEAAAAREGRQQAQEDAAVAAAALVSPAAQQALRVASASPSSAAGAAFSDGVLRPRARSPSSQHAGAPHSGGGTLSPLPPSGSPVPRVAWVQPAAAASKRKAVRFVPSTSPVGGAPSAPSAFPFPGPAIQPLAASVLASMHAPSAPPGARRAAWPSVEDEELLRAAQADRAAADDWIAAAGADGVSIAPPSSDAELSSRAHAAGGQLTVLDVSGAVGVSPAAVCAAAASNPALSCVRCVGIGGAFSPSQLNSLVSSLWAVQCLELDVHASPAELPTLLPLLARRGVRLGTLTVSGGALRIDAVQGLVQALSTNAATDALALPGAFLHSDALTALLAALPPCIGALDLSRSALGVEACRAFAAHLSLPRGETLTRLTLSENALGDEGASTLAQGLARSQSLLSLSLADCAVGPSGAAALAAALARQGCALTALDVGGNRVGDQGCAALCDCLRFAPTLQQLSLQRTALGPAAARALAAAMRHTHALTELDLAGNALGDLGARLVAAALGAGYACALQVLDLSANDVGDVGALELTEALAMRASSATSSPSVLRLLRLLGNPRLAIQARMELLRCAPAGVRVALEADALG